MDVPSPVVERCQRGEPEAFDELVRLTHRHVYSLALRIMGNADDAAEVTQETYIRLLKAIRSFRGEAKFSTWLYQVTSSVAITALRKRARRKHEVPLETPELEQMSGPDDPALGAERRELHEQLEAAIQSLPEGYRAVVVMKDVYGLSLAEAGRQLGISEGAAKVRLFRARQRLRSLLGANVAVNGAGPAKRGGQDDGMS
ncbi:MAG: RNA polymerase sigma factor [Actinomycetota bacterium]